MDLQPILFDGRRRSQVARWKFCRWDTEGKYLPALAADGHGGSRSDGMDGQLDELFRHLDEHAIAYSDVDDSAEAFCRALQELRKTGWVDIEPTADADWPVSPGIFE